MSMLASRGGRVQWSLNSNDSFLCTGGVSYALFILLLISKLFCTKGEGGGGEGGGGGGPLDGVGPENHIKLPTCSTEYKIQNIEYRMHDTKYSYAAKLMYIKLPMYTCFLWCLDLMILMGQIHYSGHSPRNGFSPSKSLRSAPYKQQVH